MAVVDKLVLKDPSNTDVEYDIGASAQNVSYTDGSTPTTVKGKLDSINTDHINKKVLGPDLNYEGPHGLRGYFDSDDEKYKLQIKDGNNQKPIESGGLPEIPLSIQNGGTGNTDGYVRAGQLAGSTIHANATAEGARNVASGEYSHAEGLYNTVLAAGGHAMGLKNTIERNSAYSFIGGRGLYLDGEDSIAFGRGDTEHPDNYKINTKSSLTIMDQLHAFGVVTRVNSNPIYNDGTEYPPTDCRLGGSFELKAQSNPFVTCYLAEGLYQLTAFAQYMTGPDEGFYHHSVQSIYATKDGQVSVLLLKKVDTRSDTGEESADDIFKLQALGNKSFKIRLLLNNTTVPETTPQYGTCQLIRLL